MKTARGSSLLLLVPCGLSLLACSGSSSSPPPLPAPSPSPSPSVAPAPVGLQLLHGAGPIVKATVNGTIHMDLLVDTGAAGTVLSAQALGVTGLAPGTYQAHTLRSLVLPNGHRLDSLPIQVADTNLSQPNAGYVNGVLGLDVLETFGCVTFDYRAGRLRFEDTQGSGAAVIPYTLNDGFRPWAPVTVGSLPLGEMLLDNGTVFTRLTPTIHASLPGPPATIFQSVVFTVSGQELVPYVVLDAYAVGGAQAPAGIQAQVANFSAVGGTYFREYLTTFCFADRELKLTPYTSRAHIHPSAIERLGLQIDIADAAELIGVAGGGAAEAAGLVVGDRLVSIDGQAIGSLGYLGVYALLGDPGKAAFTVVFMRGSGPPTSVVLMAP